MANLRGAHGSSDDLRVDRSAGSAMGNPFLMAQGAGARERARVVGAFAELMAAGPGGQAWMVAAAWGLRVATEADPCAAQAARLATLEGVAQKAAAGRDVRLLCWCHPRACHADVIAGMAAARAAALMSARRGKRRR